MSTVSAFEIDLEVVSDGDHWSIVGDDQRMVVNFASLAAARRTFQRIRNGPCDPFIAGGHVAAATEIEIRVSGRTVALSGRNIKSDLAARVFGLPGTRLFVKNLFCTTNSFQFSVFSFQCSVFSQFSVVQTLLQMGFGRCQRQGLCG